MVFLFSYGNGIMTLLSKSEATSSQLTARMMSADTPHNLAQPQHHGQLMCVFLQNG